MSSIFVGNAPCSWGTLEFGSTKSDRFTYVQVLDELVETGYAGSELGDWGFMPTDPAELAAAFRARGIALTGAYVGVALRHQHAHLPGQETVLRVARLLSETASHLKQETAPFLVLADDAGTVAERVAQAGRVGSALMLSPQEWDTVAQGAEAIAQAVAANTGLRTVFHHHCAGYVETPDEIAELLSRTDPATLGLVFDTGHYAFGAGDGATVLPGLQRFADRIEYVHFKDFDQSVGNQAAQEGWDYFQAVAKGVFCELGEGSVDFPAVLDWLRQQNYTGPITVEQDVLPGMGTPKQSARRNRVYLESIGL